MVTNSQNPNDPRTLLPLWLLPVLGNQNTPPVAPNDGDRYRVTSVATGAWTGKEDKIAVYDMPYGVWRFETLTSGMVWYDQNVGDWHYMNKSGTITQFDKLPIAISDVTGLQSALDGKAAIVHAANHISGASDPLTGNLDAVARSNVKKNGGAVVGTRRTLNLIEGANIAITAADDNAGEKVDITIASTSSIVTNFDDSTFDVFNHADVSKILKIDASPIATATTITVKAPAASGTLMTLENAETITATKTSSKNGDVLIPAVDTQGNIGSNTKRFALVRAVNVQSGDLVLCDRKTGKQLYVIHEDEKGIYFSNFKTRKCLMILDTKGNLGIAGKLFEKQKFKKYFVKPKNGFVKNRTKS